MFPIILPPLDPIAVSFGPVAIRWYSLAYIAGILFGLFWLKKCNSKEQFLSNDALDNWLTWAVFSIILGGRLGYVLFYNFSYFLNHPLEIFAFWHGGMSFHGGLLGMILGMWFFAKRYKASFWKLMDAIATAAPIGIFFGRLANFANMELYGRVSGSDFGVIFPNAGDLPRHPSQLYEASLEGIALFIILFLLSKSNRASKKPGTISGAFLVIYGAFRILVENFREPDWQIGFFKFGDFQLEFLSKITDQITLGQILSLPLIFSGILIIFLAQKEKFFKKKLA